MPSSQRDWTDERLAALNAQFESVPPATILQWGIDAFGTDLVQATGFGPSGIVIMHHLAALQPGTTVFYVNTDVLFAETYELRDELAARLPLRFTEVHSGVSLKEQAAQHGPALWERDPDKCCEIRKVRPFREFLSTKAAWISGVRRDQSADRASTPIVTWDERHGLVKLNPLAAWTRKQVWRYIHEHDLPYNPLHDEGYPSLGCTHCTKRAAPSDGERAGRWTGFQKTECGLHA